LDSYHSYTICAVREQGREDAWLFFEVKRGPEQIGFGNTSLQDCFDCLYNMQDLNFLPQCDKFIIHCPSIIWQLIHNKTKQIHKIQSGPKKCIHSCSSSAASTVFECRWWPLRTPTLNPKFKTSLISILLLYKYSSYDYRVILFMSKCVYIFLGHSV